MEIATKKALPYLSNAYCEKVTLCIQDLSVRDLYTHLYDDAAQLQKWTRRSVRNTSIGTLTLDLRHVDADSVKGTVMYYITNASTMQEPYQAPSVLADGPVAQVLAHLVFFLHPASAKF